MFREDPNTGLGPEDYEDDVYTFKKALKESWESHNRQVKAALDTAATLKEAKRMESLTNGFEDELDDLVDSFKDELHSLFKKHATEVPEAIPEKLRDGISKDKLDIRDKLDKLIRLAHLCGIEVRTHWTYTLQEYVREVGISHRSVGLELIKIVDRSSLLSSDGLVIETDDGQLAIWLREPLGVSVYIYDNHELTELDPSDNTSLRIWRDMEGALRARIKEHSPMKVVTVTKFREEDGVRIVPIK